MGEVVDVITIGNPLLRRRATEVADPSNMEIRQLAENMLATMVSREGVGIAAPQTGQSKRVVIIASAPNSRYPDAPFMEPLVMVNPLITQLSEEMEDGSEGCLSVPCLRLNVKRHQVLNLTWQDLEGNRHQQSFSGFVARIIQHEIDHLDGVLFPDRAVFSGDGKISAMQLKAVNNLALLRETRLLVHNITNFVVMNFTANILLAAGASPVMAHAVNEVEEMVTCAGALVLNIGTLADDWVEAMIVAARKATGLGVPIILDPVGAGATVLRTTAARRILAESRVSLVRGNASEILALAGGNARIRGVDSAVTVDSAATQAIQMSRDLGVPVAITGPVDFITDGERVVRVANGHPMMSSITGTGCGATAVIAAFSGLDNDPVSAAATALAYYGLAGEKAAESAAGPGSFMAGFLDALYGITSEELLQGCRITEGLQQ